jgi:hypothetical protein
MKRKRGLMGAMLCALLLIPCLAAAQNCPLWLGTWEVKYEDNSTRIWKIYESTDDTGSTVVLCKAFGYSETTTGTDQRPFMILYIKFTGTYSYTEQADLTSGMESTEVDVNNTNDAFVSRPDGQYPVASGKKTSSEIPPEPTFTTTTTAVSTTTTTVSGPCPAVKILGDNDLNAERLRVFRDSTLAQSTIGRRVIQLYYSNAGSIDEALERSPALRYATRRMLQVLAPMLERKEN